MERDVLHKRPYGYFFEDRHSCRSSTNGLTAAERPLRKDLRAVSLLCSGTEVIMAGKQKTTVWKNFLHLIRQIRLPLILIAASFLLNIGRAVIALTVPERIAALIEMDIGDSAVVRVVIGACLTIFLLALTEFIGGLASTYITYIAKAQMNRDFQRVASRKVFSLTAAEVEARDPKEFISRITTDTGFVSDFLIDLLVMEIPRLYFLISTVIKVSQMGSGTLVLGFVAVIPVIILGAFWSGRVTYKAQDRLQSVLARLTAKLAEKVEHPEIIKAYNKTEDEIAGGEICIDEMRKAQKKAVLAAAFNQLIANILFIVPTLIIMLFAALPLLAGQISVAFYITYIGLGATYQKYIADHLTLWVLAKKAQGATVRISGILQLEEDRGGLEKAEKTGELRFDRVSFSLDGKKILDDVSFTVRDGSKFAIVGESGSGKSTLLSLIEQFYRPGEGRITLDGVNVQDYEISGYRALFSYLPQNAPGFSGTVRELLTYGSRRSHTDEALMDMLQKVGMSESLKEMGGLDYEVGQDASRLSGGQRQRLAVARMLLSDARIVLADEATSALDIHGTRTVAKLIDEYAKGKTRILVSHDLSTVIDADAILVLDHGRVAGFGTHEELLRSCPQYAGMLSAGEEVVR